MTQTSHKLENIKAMTLKLLGWFLIDPGDLYYPLLWRYPSLHHQSAPQLHAKPSVLMPPPGPLVLLGCTQVPPHTLLTDARNCFQAAHQVSLWTPGKRIKLWVFLRVQRAIKQPIYINILENKLSLCLSRTFLPESATSRRNKTMCVYCVTSTDLTKVSKAAMKQ